MTMLGKDGLHCEYSHPLCVLSSMTRSMKEVTLCALDTVMQIKRQQCEYEKTLFAEKKPSFSTDH